MPSVRGEVMWKTKACRPFLAFTLLIQVSNSILVNHTIDDSLGDLQTGLKVQYLPLTDGSEPVWKSQDTSNDTCFVNPDPTEAHFNTWSSASCSGSDTVSATFSFHGTAIYIYFIISSCLLHSGFVNAANCDFWVDGQFVGNYMQFPAVGVFGYNTLVYANDSLSDSLHTFAIQPRDNSFLIFDYAEYTTDVEVAVPLGPTSTLPEPTSPEPMSTKTTLPRPTSNASVTSPTAAPTRSLLRLTSNASIASMTSTNSIANTISTSGATSPTATPTRSSTHTGVIVGGTVAGVAGIVLVALGVILYRRRALLSDAPTISTVLPRKTRSGHVSPFMLAGPPAAFSIPPSKMRREHTSSFTSQEEAGIERWTSDPPQTIATSHDQGGPSTQSKSTAQNTWKNWRFKFNERTRKDLLPGPAARPIRVLVGSPSSNVFE